MSPQKVTVWRVVLRTEAFGVGFAGMTITDWSNTYCFNSPTASFNPTRKYSHIDYTLKEHYKYVMEVMVLASQLILKERESDQAASHRRTELQVAEMCLGGREREHSGA